MPVLFAMALAATRNFNRHGHEDRRFREEVGQRLLLGDGEAMGDGDAGDGAGLHGRFLPWDREGPYAPCSRLLPPVVKACRSRP